MYGCIHTFTFAAASPGGLRSVEILLAVGGAGRRERVVLVCGLLVGRWGEGRGKEVLVDDEGGVKVVDDILMKREREGGREEYELGGGSRWKAG